MFEIGSSLKEARLRQGVDLNEAEAATKVRAKYLRALEDERFEILPAQTYVKGFLRAYADYLGLDGQLYVDEFNSRYVPGDDELAAMQYAGTRPPRGRTGESSPASSSQRSPGSPSPPRSWPSPGSGAGASRTESRTSAPPRRSRRCPPEAQARAACRRRAARGSPSSSPGCGQARA